MRKALYRTVLAMLVCTGTSTAAQVIEGSAKVIDGDLLWVGGTEVRLSGVDAPELSQPCFEGKSSVPCGTMAKAMLESVIDSGRLACDAKDKDTHGRVIAVCRTSGVDIGEKLVAAGWATSLRRYGDDFVASEMRARAQRAGIWKWEFTRPEDYRADLKAEPAQLQAQVHLYDPQCSKLGSSEMGNVLSKATNRGEVTGFITCPACPITTIPGAKPHFALRRMRRLPAIVARLFARD